MEEKRVDNGRGLCITALIFSLLPCGVLPIVAIILGAIGAKKSKAVYGKPSKMAVAAIIISIISIVLTIVYFFVFCVFGQYYDGNGSFC